MQFRIRYFNLKPEPAIVLNAGPDWMRAALPDRDDAIEFRCVGGQWFQENDEPVWLDFADASASLCLPALVN